MARPGQLNATFGLFSTGNEKAWPWSLVTKPTLRGHKVAAAGESAGAVAMQPLLARCEEEGVESIYDTAATALVVNDAGRVVGLHARQGRLDTFVRARRGVILATGGFGMNSEMVREYIPDIGENAEPLGVPTNDGSGILLGISAGGATRDLGGIIATCSIYPPERLINGIIVNKEGRRFVAEDVYHGRLAAFVMEQPDQTAWLIVNEETFAYPEAGHKLIDGWETVAEMERELGVPQGSIERTLADYNRDAKDGVDRRHHKHTDYLKPLDIGPWAAFDLSFKRSPYVFLTLGGLRTGPNGEALNAFGAPIAGLYAVGACAAHLPRDGKGYASGLSLAPGSFFGRQAGSHAADAAVV